MTTTSFNPSNNYAGKQTNNMKTADLTEYGNNGLITGLKVIWSDYIVGLELLFNGQSAGVIKGTHNQQNWEENVNLQQEDYIVQIFGRSGNVINCIGFKTAKGYTKVWGNPLEGESFTFGLNDYFIKALKLGVGEYLQYMEPIYEHVMYATAQKLPFSNNGKFTTTVGKARNNGESFDDWDWLSAKFNYQIAEVKMWHDGKFVYGIQFFYNLDGTKKTAGKHCAEVNGLRTETLSLAEDEHITKVLIRAGDWVDHITLLTDQGRSLSAGGSGGKGYIAVTPQSHHFVAVGGSTSGHLDSISFYYDEIC